MTTQEKLAARVIRNHYNLHRPVTRDEVKTEITNLIRKQGNYDDLDARLAARLELVGIKFHTETP